MTHLERYGTIFGPDIMKFWPGGHNAVTVCELELLGRLAFFEFFTITRKCCDQSHSITDFVSIVVFYVISILYSTTRNEMARHLQFFGPSSPIFRQFQHLSCSLFPTIEANNLTLPQPSNSNIQP
jgi:hypothetical protein